ncbi:MAG: PIN domain-containing protein [Thermoanaerobaculia bacterium]
MIAPDSSTIIAYLAGEAGTDVAALDRALADGIVGLPPVVLTEILSDGKLPSRLGAYLREIPLLAISDGYWERAGDLRRKVLASARKARLADTLIAQSCIDHEAPLITRDRDFRAFARVSPLKLLPSK